MRGMELEYYIDSELVIEGPKRKRKKGEKIKEVDI